MANRQFERHYGVADAQSRATLTGLDLVRGYVDGSLPMQTMAKALSYDIVEVEPGRVIVVGFPSEQYCNPEGSIHGGFAATLLDTCMGLAVRSTLEAGFGSLSLELKVSFVRPIRADTGTVRAEGSVLNCGRRIGTAEGRLSDDGGKLLAHATTTCLIFAR